MENAEPGENDMGDFHEMDPHESTSGKFQDLKLK